MLSENFTVSLNPYEYSKSNIDINPQMTGSATGPENDYFTLFEFSAKYDPVPTMLTQNHTAIIKGFYGQTTSFRKSLIKSSVVIMGEKREVKKCGICMVILGKDSSVSMADMTPKITNIISETHLQIWLCTKILLATV